MNKNFAAITLAAALLTASAQAKVSFSLDIEALSNSVGSPLSNSGLLVLVVDKDRNGFQGPVAGALVTGDDEIVTWWDLSEAGPGTTDITLLTEGGVTYGGGWSEGDPLALYWFPNLSTGNLSPAADEEYGVFADVQNLASGDEWKMPADGTLLHSLKLFTSAATKLVMFGDLPEFLGQASYAVNSNSPVDATRVGGVQTEQQGGNISVSWSEGAAPGGGFIVKRRVKAGEGESPRPWSTVALIDPDGTGFQDSNTKAGLEYEYEVFAVNGLSAPQPAAFDVLADRSVFANISARGHISSGPADPSAWKLLNAGVVLAGEDPFKTVMALGFGPYRNETIPSTAWVGDTFLEYEVIDGGVGTVVARNDDWMSDHDNPNVLNPDAEMVLATMGAVGAPVFNVDDPDTEYVSRDSALLEDLSLGTANLFRVTAKDNSGFVGIGLFDAEYEAEVGDNYVPEINDNRIVNLSTRGYLAPSGTFNGGIVIRGDANKEVLAVASGPRLTFLGSPASVVLENPRIELQRLNPGGSPASVVIATNLDWDQPIAQSPGNGLVSVETDISRIQSALESRNFNPDHMTVDSAMLVTLEPGNYVFRVYAESETKLDGSVQIALWEIEME